MSRFKKARYFFEYALIRFLAFFINLLPFSFALFLARPVGMLIFWFSKRRRRVALDNLHQTYGLEKSESEIQKIARDTFVHLCEFGIEWLRIPQIAKTPEKYLAITHVERIHSVLKTQKKGALLLVSHNGNWELMALIAGLWIGRPIGRSIFALARPLKNPYLYDYAMRLRGITGLKSIPKIGAVRQTLRRLKENEIVCLLVDQRVSEGSVESHFFGREALTTSLPAIAALRWETPIFFVFLHKANRFHYTLDVEGPVPIQDTGDQKQDIQTNTQRFNHRIETEIRKDPAHWLWMHNRWRLEGMPKS